MKKISTLLLPLVALTVACSSFASNSTFEKAEQAILKQAGCYLVDYSWVETESLKEGYKTDGRVYDSNADKTTYELIVPIRKSANEIRLQHVLFLKDLKTGEVKGTMKHHAEDWAFESDHHYEFISKGLWHSVPSTLRAGWTRKTTNLDDGLRYQCEAQWNFDNFHPEWNCANFSPIPGREIRDMGRKDYNTLDRKSRVIVYDSSWIERQDNVKTIQDANGGKTPLAREHGRTWYIRQPDSACDEARDYAASKVTYWKVLMEVWEEYFAKGESWSEVASVNGLPRFVAMFAVEEKYSDLLRSNPELASSAKGEIRAIIEQYRVK